MIKNIENSVPSQDQKGIKNGGRKMTKGGSISDFWTYLKKCYTYKTISKSIIVVIKRKGLIMYIIDFF